ncbi:unnamed protein product [Psylliodes chrysocephalus]|uniref:COMM domain-containing protein 3 n=1 Tax=Psylliodes chrysocephalus TaxID=3402493 RepID=A0A9P0C9G7_9CUCU|nr:unnamed protein product [Psylliodes chrysocephala]
MKIFENYKSSLSISRNITLITDDIFKKIIENCFSFLTEKKEIHSTSNLYKSKPDVTKEFYAALLAVTAEFARKNVSKEEIIKYLTSNCGLPSDRADLYAQNFEKERTKIEISLLNIGSSLPHVSDIKWKIDHIVKSSEMDSSEGPLFRICLIAEQYDNENENKALKNIHFTCNSVELLDLIYKLKDALRHCNNLTHRVF